MARPVIYVVAVVNDRTSRPSGLRGRQELYGPADTGDRAGSNPEHCRTKSELPGHWNHFFGNPKPLLSDRGFPLKHICLQPVVSLKCKATGAESELNPRL